MTRVLNLYAGIGGNRALWPAEVQVTAVEFDPETAAAYAELWPNDEIIIADAHQYLLEHFTDGWDLIWASPPCQSHSRLNAFEAGKGRYRYPDIGQLYGEILLLQHRHKKPWVIENVIAYYQPLIAPTAVVGRHWYWSNFPIPKTPPSQLLRLTGSRKASDKRLTARQMAEAPDYATAYGIPILAAMEGWSRTKKRQAYRNCVEPETGLAILNAALGKTVEPELSLLDFLGGDAR